MAKPTYSRRQLLDRLSEIEEKDEAAWSDPSLQEQILQLKQDWFLDTFTFLISLPKDTHIWCGSWELMTPLLETFYNYFKDERDDSSLKILWRRISQEMRQCTQCTCQHHQAQEMYNSEYEQSTIGPLLDVLQSLDEERVSQHLKELNVRIGRGEYDAELHNAEVVSVLFEVLMYPVLLDDQSLANEFQIFIEGIDNCHELTLAGRQQYPGVYALFFFKSRRTRSIGHRLAGSIGKLRRAADLEPLHPLLKKCIGYLETEVLPSTSETLRPRVQLDRINVWLGIKALLGFLEPPAFEEGIYERYPIFLSIVLNHVSDDSPEFPHAVNCLKLLFEMLGCKLWLRTTLSPSVMRNTLLGQCFHTRNEKSHKDIFDLFQPFLQSVEALQDGEHEKQRRHFLYFLLHQVKMSSNFSDLMRKKACQIALLIIHRGYKMNPPCPPFECAHMWGPSVIHSLKDSSLHDSLRQPAFDLIHTILVSDAAALTTSLLKGQIDHCTGGDVFTDDDGDEILFCHDVEEKDSSCWSEFSFQNKLVSRECSGWMCVPMLWVDALVEINPSVLPTSFHKAVHWAASRFALVELENNTEKKLPIRDFLSSYSGNMCFQWEAPTGSDDGGDGNECKNSVKTSTMCIPLSKIFRRLSAHFILQMEQGELWKQWTWEPRMAESLILLFIDPNYEVRQVNSLMLDHVSKTRGLTGVLQFLSSSESSLSSIYLGLRHAMKLVQLDSVFSKFPNLHQCFFVLCKLLKEAVPSPLKSAINPSDNSNPSSFSSQGGFLRQPFMDAPADGALGSSIIVDLKYRERLCVLLSEVLWPSLRKCLAEGKVFINNKSSQMTCVRILEILPVVFERLSSALPKISGIKVDIVGFKWLHDFMDWGTSSLEVVARYWRQCLTKLLDLITGLSHQNSAKLIKDIEALISDGAAVDEMKEPILRLSVSLSSEVACTDGLSGLKPTHPILENFPFRKSSTSDRKPSYLEDDEVVILDLPKVMNDPILVSDDEGEENVPSSLNGKFNDNDLVPAAEKSILQGNLERKSVTFSSNSNKLQEAFQVPSVTKNAGLSSQKHKVDTSKGNHIPALLAQSKVSDSVRQEMNKPGGCRDTLPSQGKSQSLHKTSSHKAGTKSSSQAISLEISTPKPGNEIRDDILKNLVHDNEDDPWERAAKAARRPPSLLAKSGPSVLKRQVIPLNMPGQNRFGNPRKDTELKRLKPPRLDEWYRPILEMDYFSTVGLSSANEDETAISSELKEVPVCFQTPDQYVDIFRPLVLEELKAQVQSSFSDTASSEEKCCGSISILSVERIDDFHLIRCSPVDSESAASRDYSENDLVLLTRQPLQNSTHDIHVVGKVERRDKDNKRRSIIFVIRFYLQNGSSRLNKAKRFLMERSRWYVSRIMSITPQIREFQALSSLRDIPMLPIILKPSTHHVGNNGFRKIELDKLPQPLQQALMSSFNESQLLAISAAIGTNRSRRDFELSLIQGPPGTGKTRTILAIVSGLLAFRSQQNSDTVKQPNSGLGPCNTSSVNSRRELMKNASLMRVWEEAALARQLSEEAKKSSKSVDYSTRVRVLICAQSNAAVDELVSRISKEGLYGTDGVTYKPYLVRVGNPKTIHPSSLPFFIDTLVDQRLTEAKMNESAVKNDMIGETSNALRSSLEKLVELIRSYEAKRANIRGGCMDSKSSSEIGAHMEDGENEISEAAVDAKLKSLNEQRRKICSELNASQAREKKTYEERKALRSKLKSAVLREAEIVVTTLSGCGGDLHRTCSESLSNYKFGISSEHTLFDAVVIDEAAQALEPATLIPLQLLKSKETKCIMVGDPKQLPATVISQVASKFLYECSMFERLQRAGHPVIMLTDQYRMHPEICQFPSLHFYDNKLLNGKQMTSKVAAFHKDRYLGPYVFFDVIDGQEGGRKNSSAVSHYNEDEANAAVEILKFFRRRYASEFIGGRIGIISPYKSQVSLLRSRISNAFGPVATADIEFNTVDGFQGREVDILILSTVRSSEVRSSLPGVNPSVIGFVADVRRMNVALTRAKLSLWILGNASTLSTNRNWCALLNNANARNLVVKMSRPYHSVFKEPSASKISHNPNPSGGYAKETIERQRKDINGVSERRSRPNAEGIPKIPVNRNHPDNVSLKQDSLNDLKPPMIEKHGSDNRGKGKVLSDSWKCISTDTIHTVKTKVNCEDSRGDNKLPSSKIETDDHQQLTTLNLRVSRGAPASSEDDMKQSKSRTEDRDQEREVKDRCVATNKHGTKDMVASRKQQRDAVEAILPSALLSSKKLETTSNSIPLKRPSSPTTKGVPRPLKKRRVPRDLRDKRLCRNGVKGKGKRVILDEEEVKELENIEDEDVGDGELGDDEIEAMGLGNDED